MSTDIGGAPYVVCWGRNGSVDLNIGAGNCPSNEVVPYVATAAQVFLRAGVKTLDGKPELSQFVDRGLSVGGNDLVGDDTILLVTFSNGRPTLTTGYGRVPSATHLFAAAKMCDMVVGQRVGMALLAQEAMKGAGGGADN